MRISVLSLAAAIITTATALSPALAQSTQDNEVFIIPYLIPEVNGQRIVYVSPDAHVVLGARWGACTPGLARSWIGSANVYYEIDGEPLPLSHHQREYWTSPQVLDTGQPEKCILPTEAIWVVYWRYEYGTMDPEPGEYDVFFHYWGDRPVVDGGDWDEDGKMDVFRDVNIEVEFTIVVQ